MMRYDANVLLGRLAALALVVATMMPVVAGAQPGDTRPIDPVVPTAPQAAPRPVEPRAAPASPLKGIVRELRSGPLLMHGNYCGVGNRPGAAPIDALDAACMRHDACTKTGTLPGCACNERLRLEAAAIAQDPRAAPDELVAAAATASAMAVLVCKSGGHLEVPILPTPR